MYFDLKQSCNTSDCFVDWFVKLIEHNDDENVEEVLMPFWQYGATEMRLSVEVNIY